MDPKQLRNIITVIEKGSLNRASAALNISQPALTKSIQRLEERLGVPLFTRDGKGMRPTVYGEALRPHAHAILASTEQAIREIEGMSSGARGTVSVAAGPLMTTEILSRAMLRIMRQHPLIHVKIHTAVSNHVPGLLSGQYDFILAQLPIASDPTGLVQHELVHDRVAIIARPGHAVLSRSRVGLQDLLRFKWVLPEAGNGHRLRLAKLFESEGLKGPEPDIECSSTDLTKMIVLRSDHLGLIARMGIKSEGRSKPVEIVMNSPFMARPIGMIWRQNQVHSRSSEIFMSTIKEVCREDPTIVRRP